MTLWSARPSAAAWPELVVAIAANPMDASNRAEPMSHAFGITNSPSRCNAPNRSRRSLHARGVITEGGARSGYVPGVASRWMSK